MPEITGNQTLGAPATPFISGTRVWRLNAEDFAAAAGIEAANNQLIPPQGNEENIYTAAATDIINARDCIISCRNVRDEVAPIGTEGTWNLDNVVLDTSDIIHGANAYTLNWNDVTFQHTPRVNTETVTFGNWPGGNPASPYTFNNVNLWPDPLNTTDLYITSLACFLTNGNDTSTFNGVSLWNGESGAEIRGTALYSGGDLVWNSPVVGPIGFTPDGFGTGYNNALGTVIMRAGGANVITGSFDYRGLQDNNDTEWRFILDFDGWWINPLVGESTQGNQAINVFGGTASTTRVLVGTGVDTQSTFIKYINADTDHDMYTFPATVSPTNLPTIVANNIVEDSDLATNSANGIAFEHQAIVGSIQNAGGTNVGTGPGRWNGAVTTQITTPTNRPFRTYSWDRTQWGPINIITTPGPGATDQEVATARALGYDHHSGAGFTTTTNYDNGDAADVLVSEYSSPALATVTLNQVGGVTNGREVGALVKTIQYNDLVVADGATANALPYTHTGTTLDFGTNSLTFSTTATTLVENSANYTIPAASFHVDANEVITNIDAQNIITSGDYTTTDAKVAFDATNAITLGGALTNINLTAGTSVNMNSNFITDVTLNTSAINNWPISNTHSGTVFNQTATVLLNSTTTPSFDSIDEVLGTHTLGAGVTLTINSLSTITINAPGPGYVAGTNVTFVTNWNIENDRTVGLLSVWRNGTLTPGITNVIANIQPSEVIDVVYSERGRTDFLQRMTADGTSPGAQTITISNAPTPYPSAATGLNAGTFVTNAPVGGVMNISVTENQTSQTAVSRGLQEQVKETVNYNTLIQQTQETDFIASGGSNNPAGADETHIQFISTEPISIGYVQPTGGAAADNPSVLAGTFVDGTFTPDGGGAASSISIGVTLGSPEDFDPGITGSQVNTAVTTIAGRIDGVDTALLSIGGDVGTVINDVGGVHDVIGTLADTPATGDTATLVARQKTIEADTHDMRSNRLLGLKPQSVQS